MRIALLRSRAGRAACCVMTLCAAAGCQTAPAFEQLTEPAIEARWLPWLRDAQTTRQEVVRTLGEPTQSYEGDRLVAYHLYLSNPKQVVTPTNFSTRYLAGFGKIQPDTQLCAEPAAPSPETELRVLLSPATYGLVLVYDRGDVVRAHTLLWRAR